MAAPARANSLRGYIVLSLAWLAVVCVVWFAARQPAPQPIQVLPAGPSAPTVTPIPTPAPSPFPTPGPLRVDVAGAVQVPGVYRLPSGSIVADAILAAGGPAANAALQRLNKAVGLQDGMQVYVPQFSETALPTPLLPMTAPPTALPRTGSFTPAAARPGQASGNPLPAPGPPIDLNQATSLELETLPGIGPALAKAIVAGRPYSTVDDLDRVPGIGPGILARLKPYVTIR